MTKLVDSNVAKAASEAAKKQWMKVLKTKSKKYTMVIITPMVVMVVVLKDNQVERCYCYNFGIIGGRSHLFSNYEEREMHKIGSSIVNHEISKLKLN